MNLRNISGNQIIVWAVMLLGFLLSIAIGTAVGGSDLLPVAGVLGMIFLSVVFINMKTNIWILLPCSWYLTGRLGFLPLPLTVRDICFLLVIFAFGLFFVTRALPWARKLRTLDYFIYVNLFYLATVYFRNPVGTFALQTELVGGRPYFEIALAFGAYLILSRVPISAFVAKIFPLFFILPAAVVSLLEIIARLSPNLASPIGMIYSGVGGAAIGGVFQEETKIGETRIITLKDVGLSGVLALAANYRPMTLVSPLFPFRVLFFLMFLGAIFAAGFRSVVLIACVYLLLSTLLRRSVQDLWTGLSLGLLSLILLVSLQGSAFQLPMTMQRALSWLPGDWSHEALEDAEGSSQWRFEMWEWAWNDERIMRNKIWGQGFGFTLDEMNIIASALLSGQQGAMFLGKSDREQFMITGTFHSGPLSTIKFIGVFGLVLYYFLMVYMAIQAWSLCRRAYGTKAFTLALFVGIPIIYEPIHFMLIFGALEMSYVKTLFYAGLMNMAGNYLQTCTQDTASVLQTDSLLSREPIPAVAADRI